MPATREYTINVSINYLYAWAKHLCHVGWIVERDVWTNGENINYCYAT